MLQYPTSKQAIDSSALIKAQTRSYTPNLWAHWATDISFIPPSCTAMARSLYVTPSQITSPYQHVDAFKVAWNTSGGFLSEEMQRRLFLKDQTTSNVATFERLQSKEMVDKNGRQKRKSVSKVSVPLNGNEEFLKRCQGRGIVIKRPDDLNKKSSAHD